MRACVRLACSYLFILASTFLHPAATVAAAPTAKSHHLLRGTPDFDLGCPHRAYPAASDEQGSEELLYLSNHALIPTAVHHHRHSLPTAQAVDPPEHTPALICPHNNNYPHRIATPTTMSAATSTRPPFNAVDTSSAGAVLAPAAPDDVESPSLSSSNALARFEFEPGRSKEGTKVLMVEWEDDDTTRSIAGDWEISWEGKRTVLPAREHADATTKDTNATDVPVNRLYFLLGAGVAVPTTVRLQKGNIIWRTNPLPAIFSPDLGATARAAGKKGVLHTIWAKKRLQVLQKEIDAEARDNMEGVGFEMAVAEKEWIEANFGVLSKPSGIVMPAQQQESGTLNSPTSPRSTRQTSAQGTSAPKATLAPRTPRSTASALRLAPRTSTTLAAPLPLVLRLLVLLLLALRPRPTALLEAPLALEAPPSLLSLHRRAALRAAARLPLRLHLVVSSDNVNRSRIAKTDKDRLASAASSAASSAAAEATGAAAALSLSTEMLTLSGGAVGLLVAALAL